MASVTVKVHGLRELGIALSKIKEDMSLKIARQATGSGASVIKKRAKSNILSSPSVDTRSLYDAVIVKKIPKNQTRYTSEHIVTVRGRGKVNKKTGRKQREAPHGGFVEFGTKDMQAEPFLIPAFETEKRRAVDVIKDKLVSGIAKAKLAKR